MATITTAANGNFNDTSTWVGGVIPVSGDILDVNHDLTIPSGYTTPTVGAGTGNVIDIAASKRLVVEPNGTLNVDGQIKLTYGAFIAYSNDVEGSATVNLSNCFVWGNCNDSAFTTDHLTTRRGIHFQGTTNNPVLVSGISGDTCFGAMPARGTGISATHPLQHFEFVKFTNINDSANNVGFAPQLFDKAVDIGMGHYYKNCKFVGCGSINSRYLSGAHRLQFEYVNNYFSGGKGTYDIVTRHYNSAGKSNGNGNYSKILTGNYLEKGVYFEEQGSDYLITNNLMKRIEFAGGQNTLFDETLDISGNFFFFEHSSDPFIATPQCKFRDNVVHVDLDEYNPHYLINSRGDKLDHFNDPNFYVERNIFSYNGESFEGDNIFPAPKIHPDTGVNNPPWQIVVRENIQLANAVRNSLGCFTLHNRNFDYPDNSPTWIIDRNTVYLGSSSEGGIHVSEAGVSGVDVHESIKYNLFWNENADRKITHKVQDVGSNQIAIDHILPAKADYNAGWNFGTGSNFSGYHGLEVSTQNFTQVFGLHDVEGDPAFPDNYVSLAKFGYDNGLVGTTYPVFDPTLSTGADDINDVAHSAERSAKVAAHQEYSALVLAELAKHYDFEATANPTFTTSSFINYVKAGLTPTNGALSATDHGGSYDMGAIPVTPIPANYESLDQPKVTYNRMVPVNHAEYFITEKSGVFSTSDPVIFDASTSDNDAIYIGRPTAFFSERENYADGQFFGLGSFHDILGTVTSALSSMPDDAIFEYYSDVTKGWERVEHLKHDLDFMTVIGEKLIEFAPPKEWGTTTVNGKWGWFIRIRVVDSTNIAGSLTVDPSVMVGNNTFEIGIDKSVNTGDVSLTSLIDADNRTHKVIESIGDTWFINGCVGTPAGTRLKVTNADVTIHRDLEMRELGTVQLGDKLNGAIHDTSSLKSHCFGSRYVTQTPLRSNEHALMSSFKCYGSRLTLGNDQVVRSNLDLEQVQLNLTDDAGATLGAGTIRLKDILVCGGGDLPFSKKGDYQGIRITDNVNIAIKPNDWATYFDLFGIKGDYNINFTSYYTGGAGIPTSDIRTNVGLYDSDAPIGITWTGSSDMYLVEGNSFNISTVNENQQGLESCYSLAVRDSAFLATSQSKARVGDGGFMSPMLLKKRETRHLQTSLDRGDITAPELDQVIDVKDASIRVWRYGYLPYQAAFEIADRIDIKQTMLDDVNIADRTLAAQNIANALSVSTAFSAGAYSDADGNTYSFEIDCGTLDLSQVYNYFMSWMDKIETYSIRLQPNATNNTRPLVGQRFVFVDTTARKWSARITEVVNHADADCTLTFYLQDSIHEDDLSFDVANLDTYEIFVEQLDEKWKPDPTDNEFAQLETLPANLHNLRKTLTRPLIKSGTGWAGQLGCTFVNYSGVLLSTTADDGTVYTLPIPTTFKLEGLTVGSKVKMYKTSDRSLIAGTDNSTTDFTYAYTSDGTQFYCVIIKPDKEIITLENLALDAQERVIPINQEIDRTYTSTA